jgi:hypothetical protein
MSDDPVFETALRNVEAGWTTLSTAMVELQTAVLDVVERSRAQAEELHKALEAGQSALDALRALGEVGQPVAVATWAEPAPTPTVYIPPMEERTPLYDQYADVAVPEVVVSVPAPVVDVPAPVVVEPIVEHVPPPEGDVAFPDPFVPEVQFLQDLSSSPPPSSPAPNVAPGG